MSDIPPPAGTVFNPIIVHRGEAPLILSVPHAGTDLPEPFAARLRDPAAALNDADWNIDRLYGWATELGATLVVTRWSRLVIDVNRDPSGASLYPGQATTGLVPTESFDGVPLYHPGSEPDEADIAARRTDFFDPFHCALAQEIARLRADHDRVVLYDCHSIRSEVPRLFEGTLPVFNIGTNAGASADPELTRRVTLACAATGQSLVLNGRFRGGWITRHYGAPADGVHAVQMELAQRFYRDEIGNRADPEREAAAAQSLRGVIGAIIDWLD